MIGPCLFAEKRFPSPEPTLTCVGRQHHLGALQDLADGRGLPAPQLFPQLADFPSEVGPLSFVTHLLHASLVGQAGVLTGRSTANRTIAADDTHKSFVDVFADVGDDACVGAVGDDGVQRVFLNGLQQPGGVAQPQHLGLAAG